MLTVQHNLYYVANKISNTPPEIIEIIIGYKKSSPFVFFKNETHKKGFVVMPKSTNFCSNALFRTKMLYIFPYYGIINL